MKPFRHCAVAVIVAFFSGCGVLQASQNLLRNGGFEAAEKDRPEGWSVTITGDWVGEGKAGGREVVNISSDARTGRNALVIDTTRLNPRGEITDDLRTWNEPKYQITVKQSVKGLKPNSWYLLKFRVKSPRIILDEGLRFLAAVRPFPQRGYKSELGKWSINTWERRAFLPQVPIADGQYHEYVQLKYIYPDSESMEVGVDVRAPWSGKIIIDDVELTAIDPDKTMSRMEKLLAMRTARPLAKVRDLNPRTRLVDGGRGLGCILIPEGDSYTEIGAKIRAEVKRLTGADLPVVRRLADVPDGAQIVAIGSMMHNELVARLHFNRYVKVDALSPGPRGYVIWTVAEPYGLAKKQNVIVVAGSDAAGQEAAVDAFCRLLAKRVEGKTIELPYLHTVFPKRTIAPNERKVNRGRYGFEFHRWPYAGFAKWYLPRWLETGDPEVVKLARDELFEVMEYYFKNPHKHSAWDTYEVGFAWDSIEEVPVLSDEDRLKITNFLLGYMHMRPTITSDWRNMVPRLAKNIPTWNHQAKGLSAAYTMGRYFKRYYGQTDPRFDYYLAAARNAFRQQALYSKPQENSGNYTRITIKFAISYYLGEWELDFFKNGAMRRFAEYFATVCNSKGWLSGFGHTFYGYHGWRQNAGFGEYEVPLGFWYYRDGRILWWLKHVNPDYENPYHQDVEPVEWKELLGVKKTPLERGLWDPRSRLLLWGAAGAGTREPAGDVKYEESFDKISFRDSWDPDGQYMLVEGNGRGIHSGKATNQICKLSILGEDLLIGSTYRPTNVRTNDSVIVVRDGGIKTAGRSLKGQYPAYAALEAMADLPNTGFTRTTMRNFLGGTEWSRNIFWVKGKYFAMIDEVVPKDSGTYYVESNLRTCPNKGGSWTNITPRTGKLLEGNRGFEVSIDTPGKTKHYILTDGEARIVTDKAPALSLESTMVRQVHEGKKLAAGEKLSYINLLYGDRQNDRKNYRIERISKTEGMLFQGDVPVAYFGCGQSDKTRAVLPVDAKMFLLTNDILAVVDATSAGEFFTSEKPVSREVKIPLAAAARILKAVSGLTK